MAIVLVTGANGFIGRNVCKTLAKTCRVRASVRDVSSVRMLSDAEVVFSDLTPTFDWSQQLEGVSVIVHCAARVHVMSESSRNPLADFRDVNVYGTLNLANQAAKCGVSRFIFISTIGVNGARSGARPIQPEDAANPASNYAVSKYEAEQELMAVAGRSAMDVVIIRPPLVYGPNAPGNFSRLVKLICRQIPLPFGAVKRNRRSFIYVQNLIELIRICLDHPAAANQVLFASDDEDLSTSDLIIRLGSAMETSVKLIPVPTWILYWTLVLIGRSDAAISLCRSLEIDIRKTKNLLNWKPEVSVNQGLRLTAETWRE